MKANKSVTVLFFFLIPGFCRLSIAQNRTILSKSSPDCANCIPISISSKKTSYGPTVAPAGYGKTNEIQSFSKTDVNSFEKEHNSAWYKLNILEDGLLGFEIQPMDSTNDYDFLLYKYTDSSTCSKIFNKETKPVRSNLSKVNPQKFTTGLSPTSPQNFIGKGPGSNFSSCIQVKKNDQYILVLDNIATIPKGYTLNFYYFRKFHFQGIVTDFLNSPIAADVTLTDLDGNEITKAKSDPKTGAYSLTAYVKENQTYYLLFDTPNFFPSGNSFNSRNGLKNDTIFHSDGKLTGLVEGGVYDLAYNKEFIGFFYDSELSGAYALCNLMKKNPKMKIEVQGHSDLFEVTHRQTSSATGLKSDEEISNERADFIIHFLYIHGISTDRLIKKTFSSSKLKYPHPTSDEERNMNKRVSIKIITLK